MTIFWTRILKAKGLEPATMTEDWALQFVRSGSLDHQEIGMRALGYTPETLQSSDLGREIGFSAPKFYKNLGWDSIEEARREFDKESARLANAKILSS
jgi:hypothetical protein